MTKLSPDGSELWTQVLGISANDVSNSLSVGSDGSVFIAGFMDGSHDVEAIGSNYDAFLSMYDADGHKNGPNVLTPLLMMTSLSPLISMDLFISLVL